MYKFKKFNIKSIADIKDYVRLSFAESDNTTELIQLPDDVLEKWFVYYEDAILAGKDVDAASGVAWAKIAESYFKDVATKRYVTFNSRGQWSEELLGTQRPVIEIFRAGDYPQGSWDIEDLDKMVGNYNVSLHKAPVTLDHSQAGAAMGWVSQIFRQSDTLFGVLEHLQDVFVTKVKKKEYVNRSIEVMELEYRGEYYWPYLKAVTFLGAGAPQVKGLAEPEFADKKIHFYSMDLKDVTSHQDDDDYQGGNNVAKVELSQEKYDQNIKDAEDRGAQRAKQEFTDSETEVTRKADLKAKEDEIKGLKSDLRTERNKGFDQFVDDTYKRLLADGKMLPSDEEYFKNMCSHLSASEDEIEFSADIKGTPLKGFIQKYDNQKAIVPISERIKVDPNDADDDKGDKKSKYTAKYGGKVKEVGVKRQDFIDTYMAEHFKDVTKGTAEYRSAVSEAMREAKIEHPDEK